MNLERQTDAAAAAAAARAGARAWRVRDGLLNAHLYGGLVCCWYLLIYGVTSLAFNHPWLLPETKGALVTWQQPIALPAFGDPVKFGEAVRDELDLIGWVIPWNMRRDDKGDLHFELSRPGKKYFVVTDRAAGMTRVPGAWRRWRARRCSERSSWWMRSRACPACGSPSIARGSTRRCCCWTVRSSPCSRRSLAARHRRRCGHFSAVSSAGECTAGVRHRDPHARRHRHLCAGARRDDAELRGCGLTPEE